MSNVPQRQPYRVGLTGGIASGKSTVADIFAGLDIAVIDTDVIAREVVQPGMPAHDDIRATFGASVFADSGELDRQAMRSIVFSDPHKRRKLENILHPRIRDAAMCQATAAESPYVVIVVPLLFESPMKQAMDRILVVDCSEETQLSRLLARDAEDESQARRMIKAQASREQRLSIADDVIANDGDLERTRESVLALHDKYLRLAATRH